MGMKVTTHVPRGTMASDHGVLPLWSLAPRISPKPTPVSTSTNKRVKVTRDGPLRFRVEGPKHENMDYEVMQDQIGGTVWVRRNTLARTRASELEAYFYYALLEGVLTITSAETWLYVPGKLKVTTHG